MTRKFDALIETPMVQLILVFCLASALALASLPVAAYTRGSDCSRFPALWRGIFLLHELDTILSSMVEG